MITPDQREELDERAAIMEYDGGLPRKIAERCASVLVLNKSADRQAIYVQIRRIIDHG